MGARVTYVWLDGLKKTFISHSSGGWEVQRQDACGSGSESSDKHKWGEIINEISEFELLQN